MPIPSKQEQWNTAISNARDAVQNLIDLQDDCRTQHDAMSEKAQEGEKGESLSKICDIDFDVITEALDEAGDCEMP